MRTYGQAALDKLVKTYGTGASDDAAFKTAIGISTAAFDTAWQKANGATALGTFGPQPAPPGPVPSDWTSSGAAGSTAAPTHAAGSDRRTGRDRGPDMPGPPAGRRTGCP